MPSIKERRPYTQDSNLASHTIYTVFGSFTHELWELQFKAGVERWICYLAILFIFEIFAKTLLRESRRRNIFFIIRSVIDVRPRERNEHHLILVQQCYPGLCCSLPLFHFESVPVDKIDIAQFIRTYPKLIDIALLATIYGNFISQATASSFYSTVSEYLF